jgi:hypothetical protein
MNRAVLSILGVIATLALAVASDIREGIASATAGSLPRPPQQDTTDLTDNYRESNPSIPPAADRRRLWTQEQIDAAQPVPDWVFQRIAQPDQSPQTQSTADGDPMVSDGFVVVGPGTAALVHQVIGGSAQSPNFTYPFPYSFSAIGNIYYPYYPWGTKGKVIFENAAYGPGSFYCSGTIVTSGDGGNENLVLTAAHCLNSGGSDGTEGTWSTNVVFSPRRKEGVDPVGLWAASNLHVLSNWSEWSNDLQDYGFMVTNSNAMPCGELSYCFGAEGVAWNQTAFREYWVAGYSSGNYGGEKMMLCTASLATRDNTVAGAGPGPQGESPMAIGCPMGGGSSGSGWVIRGAQSSTTAFVNSVTSYKYTSPNYWQAVYGPYFDGSFGTLWQAARVDLLP